MTGNVSHIENPLLEEDTYTGRIFHVSLPETTNLDVNRLKNNLSGRSITLESDVDLEDREGIHIPEVFESAVKDDTQIGSIQNLTEINHEGISGVMGYIAHNKSDTVKFDDKEVLIFDQRQTRFLIFEFNGETFLLIIASRESMTTLYNMLSEELSDMGFVVDEITIRHDEFDEIADVLIDSHRMTAIEGYEDDSIHKKMIVGHNYGNSREYQREKEQGAVHGQRFGTSQLDGSTKTIQISYDCLIRSYHKVTFSMYLSMITTFIVPALSLSPQTSLTWFDSQTATTGPDHVSED